MCCAVCGSRRLHSDPRETEPKAILLPLCFSVTYFECSDEKQSTGQREALGEGLCNMVIETCVLHGSYLGLIWHLQTDDLYVLKSYFHSPLFLKTVR